MEFRAFCYFVIIGLYFELTTDIWVALEILKELFLALKVHPQGRETVFMKIYRKAQVSNPSGTVPSIVHKLDSNCI